MATIFGAIYLAAVPIFLGAFALDLLLSWRGARLTAPVGPDRPD
jgi:hypothetical protein